MKFYNPYWSDRLKISTLQRWILVQSYLYYELDCSFVSDKYYDSNAYQLVEMQKDNKEAAKESQYWYVFNDFDGTTGFDLYSRLTAKDKARIKQVAWHCKTVMQDGVHVSNDGLMNYGVQGGK